MISRYLTTNCFPPKSSSAIFRLFRPNSRLFSTSIDANRIIAAAHVKAGPSLTGLSMTAPFNHLYDDENGIAYSVYYYEHFMAISPHTRTIAVDGIMPTYETIRTQQYPYFTEVYAVIRKDLSRDSKIYKLREWLLSPEGQAVVKESGYVPLGIE